MGKTLSLGKAGLPRSSVQRSSALLEFELTDFPDNPTANRRALSGRSLVIGMLCLGIAATGLMFVYWDQHTRPFRSLREAIGRKFRHSRPNVEGGRTKGRGPKTLRISMSVDFPPGEDSFRANEIVSQVRDLVQQNVDEREFERIDVNLIQIVPEELAKTRTFSWKPGDEKAGEPPKPVPQ